MNIIKTITVSLLFSAALLAKESVIKWHTLLSEKRYGKIDASLEDIKKSILKNPVQEKKLSSALWRLLVDENLRENIKEYAKEKPKSAFSHLLLGNVYFYKAFEARGDRFVSKTPEENFEKMREILKDSYKELLESLKLDSKIPSTYSCLIAAYGMDGNDEAKNEIYKKGIKEFPSSSVIRKTYMHYSLLKWGGSIEKIEALLKDAQKYYAKNPLLKRLEGYPDYAKADFYAIQKRDYENGLKYINKALEKSDNLNYFFLRGVIYKQLKNYHSALSDFNRILKEEPLDLSTLKQREAVYLFLKQDDLALKDAQTVLKYESNDKYSHYVRGAYYYKKKDCNLAKLDFLDAVELENSVRVKKYLAYCYYADKEYKEAAEYFQKAIDAGSKDDSLYYYLSASLWYLKDCNFVKNAYRYKEFCTKNGDCDQEWADWAVKSADFAVARGICKK